MNSNFGTIAFGTVMGGAGSRLGGGNFWQGAVTGLIVSMMNHTMHSLISETKGVSDDEYNKLPDDDKIKYKKMPEDALVESTVRVLVSSGTTGGGSLLVEDRLTDVIFGKMKWVPIKNLVQSTETKVLGQEGINPYTTYFYEKYTYYSNWFMHNMGFLNSAIGFRYGPTGNRNTFYYTKIDYPGGGLTKYINYLK